MIKGRTVTLPLTDDARAIQRALAHTPPIGHGAYIYNASTIAVRQLASARIAAGAVILLSDGASIGATPLPSHNLTASSVGAAAAAAHAQIYTVGLRDDSYTPQRMSLLARVGGGEFIEATSTQLAGVFTRIEASLTSAYVVHYRSLAPLGRRVSVSVRVDGVQGGSATLTYSSPPAPAALGRPRAKPESFWTSTLALIAFSCGATVMLGLAILLVLAPRLRRDALRVRVARFTASALSMHADAAADTPTTRLSALERLLERTSWWAQFKENVEIARFDRSASELVTIGAAGTLGVALLLSVVFSSPVLGIVALFLGPVLLHSVVRHRLAKQRAMFAEQLPSHLQELASTMRAGHSLVSGITTMAQSAIEPSRSEWARVVADEQLGVPLEAAMRPLTRRMDCSDIEQVALVASLQQRSGGNMADVIDRVADGVRERADLRRELDSLTAQARLSRWVVTGLPPSVLAVVALLNPTYVQPLFDTATGQLVLGLAVVLVVIASLIMRSITEIKA